MGRREPRHVHNNIKVGCVTKQKTTFNIYNTSLTDKQQSRRRKRTIFCCSINCFLQTSPLFLACFFLPFKLFNNTLLFSLYLTSCIYSVFCLENLLEGWWKKIISKSLFHHIVFGVCFWFSLVLPYIKSYISDNLEKQNLLNSFF